MDKTEAALREVLDEWRVDVPEHVIAAAVNRIRETQPRLTKDYGVYEDAPYEPGVIRKSITDSLEDAEGFLQHMFDHDWPLPLWVVERDAYRSTWRKVEDR